MTGYYPTPKQQAAIEQQCRDNARIRAARIALNAALSSAAANREHYSAVMAGQSV